MVESSANLATELLQQALKRNKFKSMYGAKVRLAPLMNQNQMSTTKERIRQCQTHHKQVLGSLKTDYRGVIEMLDYISVVLSITLRKIIIQCQSAEVYCLCMSVDRNFYYSETNFTLPNMHKAEARDYMLSIGLHVFKHWKEPILRFLTSEETGTNTKR